MAEREEDDRLKEECGVLGVYTPDQEAARVAFFGLFALQHRGQESAGIAVSDGDKVRWEKGMGLVNLGMESMYVVPKDAFSATTARAIENAAWVCQGHFGRKTAELDIW